MLQQGIKTALPGDIHTAAVSFVFAVKLHINLQYQTTQKKLVLFPKPLQVPFPRLLQSCCFLSPPSPSHISISIAQTLDSTAQPAVTQQRSQARTRRKV